MEELLLWSMYVVCLATSVKRKRKPRSKWSRHWLLKKRLSHMELLKELSVEPCDWRNYLRMTEETYNELLDLVSPLIKRQDTVMRISISPHERLSATLRFLATGRTYKDLEFTTLISKPSLCKIIPETCKAIYMVLKKYIQFPSTTAEWEDISSDFENKWQFPHCLGSIDGKHIRIVPPKDSGSYYYNYKKTHSIVLMAIANANYEFIYCDVGANGRVSDRGVINNTIFYKRLVEKKLNIPEPKPVIDSSRVLNYVFIGDEAFAMRPDLIKPFSRSSLTNEKRIYNYRLSRARRVIENTFGILASRFRVLYTAINMDVENIEWVVLACCALHNFLRKNSVTYAPSDVFDRENTIEGATEKGLRCDPDKMHHLQRRSGGQTLVSAKNVQNKFCAYFNGEGAVPWQDQFALNI